MYIYLYIKQSGPNSALTSVQTNFRELVLYASKRRHTFTQNEHIGSDLGQREIPSRDGVMVMYSRWEDGCIYSEGSLHAAGHQGTDKLDVKCGWQVCNWHHLSNCPIQPFFTFPTCHPKSSLAREFAQFCSYLPNHRHFVAWGPGRLLSCRVAGNVRHSASGRSLGARGKQQLSFPATHCSVESSPLLNAEGQLASPCPPSQHISHQPSLHLGTRSALCVEEKGFTASSRPPTTSLVFFRAKNTTNWQGPPQKG